MRSSRDVFLFFGVNVCVVCYAFDVIYNHALKHGCLTENYNFRLLSDIPLKYCVKECAIRPMCQAVNYHRHLRLCQLLRQDFGDDFYQKASCLMIKMQDVVVHLSAECEKCNVGETCELDMNTERWMCVIKECKPLILTNGYTWGNKNAIGSRIIYECDYGYKRSTETSFSVCQADGHWSHNPKCIPDPVPLDFCPGVVLDDGKVYPIGTLETTSNFDDGDDCNPSNIYCHDNGTWETIPTCSKSVIALYLGCYFDCPNRILESVLEPFSPATTESCINQCSAQGYKFAYTEATDWCHCGNELLHFTRADESECNRRCVDNVNQICGGSWRASVYDLTVQSSEYGVINDVQKCTDNGGCIPSC